MQTTWFAAAIVLFYVLFFAVYKIASRNLTCSVMLILSLWIINIFAFYNFKFYRVSSIAWTRLPVFASGVIAGIYDKAITLKIQKWNMIKIFCCLLAFIFCAVWSFRDWYIIKLHKHGEGLWLTYIFFVPGLLMLLTELAKRLPEFLKNFLEQTGDVSLEVYMIHVYILRLCDFYKLYDKMPSLFYYVIIPVISASAGIFLNNKIFKKLSEVK